MMSAVKTVAGLACVALLLAGCGRGRPAAQDAGNKTPEAMLITMMRASTPERVPQLVKLLTDDAANQTGADWVKFIYGKTRGPLMDYLLSVTPAEMKKMQAMKSEEFFGTLAKAAPDDFLTLFRLSRVVSVEEGDQVLMLVSNSKNELAQLAMRKQPDGGYKLMSLAETLTTSQALEGKLKEKYQQLLHPPAEKP